MHEVYDEIAPHFSSTRYKVSLPLFCSSDVYQIIRRQPWPIISQFISSLPVGWVGLDSGTGNGKYLPLPLDRPTDIWTIGIDRSRNLLKIAQHAGGSHREVVWGDVLGRSWRNGAFVRTMHWKKSAALLTTFQDYAISIATIHHLATPARRKAAVKVRSARTSRTVISRRHRTPETNQRRLATSWPCSHLCVGCRTRRTVKARRSTSSRGDSFRRGRVRTMGDVQGSSREHESSRKNNGSRRNACASQNQRGSAGLQSLLPHVCQRGTNVTCHRSGQRTWLAGQSSRQCA